MKKKNHWTVSHLRNIPFKNLSFCCQSAPLTFSTCNSPCVVFFVLFCRVSCEWRLFVGICWPPPLPSRGREPGRFTAFSIHQVRVDRAAPATTKCNTSSLQCRSQKWNKNNNCYGYYVESGTFSLHNKRVNKNMAFIQCYTSSHLTTRRTLSIMSDVVYRVFTFIKKNSKRNRESVWNSCEFELSDKRSFGRATLLS